MPHSHTRPYGILEDRYRSRGADILHHSPLSCRGDTLVRGFPALRGVALGSAHQRKNRPDRSMVGDAHPTEIALLQLLQDVMVAIALCADRTKKGG